MGRREDGKEGRGDLKCGRFFRSPLTDNLFIPFKRENVSERGLSRVTTRKIECFDSLQTGKCIWTGYLIHPYRYRDFVSIPFKREGVSEPILKQPRKRWKMPYRFDSLQTGKRFWTNIAQDYIDNVTYEFRFPSNGKTYPKFDNPRVMTFRIRLSIRLLL